MPKTFFLIALLTSATVNFAAQPRTQPQNTAPVVWERYKISSQNLSFMLPKMPMVAKRSNDCESKHMALYSSYAEGSVYQMELVTRISRPLCYGSRPVPFGAATLEKRLTEIRKSKGGVSESKITVAGKLADRFERETSTRLIIPEGADPKWWIELAVHYHADNKPDLDRFLKSLRAVAEGKEIGDGSEVMLGDPITDPVQSVPSAVLDVDKRGASDSDDGRYIVLYQEKAKYTSAGRSNDTQGAVRLNITLQANGAIGEVVPIQKLKNGLTETAIEAAKRIIFLPKRVDGKPVSVMIVREYTFTIY